MATLPGMARSNGDITNTAATGSNQELAGRNPSRTFIEIQNTSDTAMWLNFNDEAAADDGIQIAAGATWRSPANYCPIGSINVLGTATKKFSYLIY